jgi:hypothetical protein
MWGWVDFAAGALCGYWLMPPVVRWLTKASPLPSLRDAHSVHLAAHDESLRHVRAQLEEQRARLSKLEANQAFRGPLG